MRPFVDYLFLWQILTFFAVPIVCSLFLPGWLAHYGEYTRNFGDRSRRRGGMAGQKGDGVWKDVLYRQLVTDFPQITVFILQNKTHCHHCLISECCRSVKCENSLLTQMFVDSVGSSTRRKGLNWYKKCIRWDLVHQAWHCCWHTVDGSEILHQLVGIVYPIIYKVYRHSRWLAGFLPSTVLATKCHCLLFQVGWGSQKSKCFLTWSHSGRTCQSNDARPGFLLELQNPPPKKKVMNNRFERVRRERDLQ